MSNSSSEIGNAILGGVLASVGMNIFVVTHNHRLNLSDILWAMTSFRESTTPCMQNGSRSTFPSSVASSSSQEFSSIV